MRADEFDKKLNEAMPMGTLQSAGQKIKTYNPFSTLSRAGAQGQLQSGNLANKLAKDYATFLGQIRQQATPKNLLQFLQKEGYPLKSATEKLKKMVPAPIIGEKAARIAKPVTSAKTTRTPKAATPVKTKPVTRTTKPVTRTTKPPVKTTKPTELGLVPKDIALEPMEPTGVRKDITDVPTNVKPEIERTPWIPKQGSIAYVPINQNTINKALMAAATEYFAGGSVQPATPSPTPTTSRTTVPSTVSSATGPSVLKSFSAGMKGERPGSYDIKIPKLDFNDENTVNYVAQKLDQFSKSGGKLDPRTKQVLQQIITKL